MEQPSYLTPEFIKNIIKNEITIDSKNFENMNKYNYDFDEKISPEILLEYFNKYKKNDEESGRDLHIECKFHLFIFASRTQKILHKFGKEYYYNKFDINDEALLNYIDKLVDCKLRISKTYTEGLQLHNTTYKTLDVMRYITEKFTVDEIIKNYELIPDSFLISEFCKRDDFDSGKLLKLQKLVLNSDMDNEQKDMIMYDLCLFCSHLKDKTQDFDWDFMEKFRVSRKDLFCGGSYTVL